MKVRAEQVKALIRHARNQRDRFIILTLFQSGMHACISTPCGLEYSDVAQGLKENEHLLKLELYRPKTGVGRDAVQALKAYLSDMQSRGVEFS